MVHKAGEKKETQISMEEITLPTSPEEIEAEEMKQQRVDNLQKAREARKPKEEEEGY